jgi:hypothetical protein
MEKLWIVVIVLSVPGHEKVTIDDDMRFEKEWQCRRHAEAIVMNYPHLPIETHCERREAKRQPPMDRAGITLPNRNASSPPAKKVEPCKNGRHPSGDPMKPRDGVMRLKFLVSFRARAVERSGRELRAAGRQAPRAARAKGGVGIG